MAQQSILPIDVSQGIDQAAAECVGGPRVADARNVRICGPGDVRAAPGYSALPIATSDTVSPTTGALMAACSTDGIGTTGLVHQDDDLFLARLLTGSNQRLWWSRVTSQEASADIPQLGGIYSRVLGTPATVVGGAEQALCHSVQVHAHDTLGIIAVINSTNGVLGNTVNQPTAAELRVLQKGVSVSSMPLTWSGAPGIYGVAPIIRDGYMAAMFGTVSGAGPYTWTGTLVVWRLSDMVSMSALPAPIWTEAVVMGGLSNSNGTSPPLLSLNPDGTRLAVAISGKGVYIRVFASSTTITNTDWTNFIDADIQWSSTGNSLWLAGCDTAGYNAVYHAVYSSAGVTVVAKSSVNSSGPDGASGPPSCPVVLVCALGWMHVIYVGAGAASNQFADGMLIAYTIQEDSPWTAFAWGPLDYGRPAAKPFKISADRGYMLTATYSIGQTVLRTTYALELRFSAAAPYIVAEMAGSAMEGQTPHNINMQGFSAALRDHAQLSSIALATTELQEPQISHMLEGSLTPRYIVAGAVLSPDPFAASSLADIDRNPRVGVVLSWEALTSTMPHHMLTRGSRARSVSGGALITHGAPLWITPIGRDLPGFPDVIPTFYAATGGGGSIPAGSYQLCFVAEHVDALGLMHRSPPSYPVTLAPGSSNQTFTVNAPQGIPVYGRTDVGGGTQALGFSLSLYMTQAGGSIMYLVRRGVVPGTQITVTTVPPTSNPVLYTQAGQVPRYSPPQMSCLAMGKERALCGGVWRSTEVRFSLLIVPGEGLAWPHPSYPQWRVQMPSDVRSVAALGDAWAVFCGTGIYVITGDGPDDNGAGGSFSPPTRVSTLALGSCRSVTESDEGVYFQSTDGHMYIMQTGSAQCTRITEKIRDSFGVSRMGGAGPEWQTVTGAVIEGATGDLCITQWGYPGDTESFAGQQSIWRFSRAHGTWSVDVTPVAYVAGSLPPCMGLYELRLPGDGHTLFAPNNASQVAVQAQGAFSPTASPTAKITTTWMSPFGAHGDGQIYGVSVLSGYPRRSEEYQWAPGTERAQFTISVQRVHDGAVQSSTLLPFGTGDSTLSPSWRTVEVDLAEQAGRQLRVEVSWTEQRVSLASIALQGAPTARFERIADGRTG